MLIVPAEIEQGAYTAGYSIRPLWWLALGLAIPGVFVVVGMTSRPPDWTFVMAGLVCAMPLVVAFVWRLRSIARRKVVLVVDSRGVWLGDDGIRGAAREPDGDTRVPHIGVVRRGKIFGVRNTSGWHIDRGQARAAIAKFGGVPFREAPVQDDVPNDWHQGLDLPDGWFTVNP